MDFLWIFFWRKNFEASRSGSQAPRSRSDLIRERSMKIDEDGMRASQAQDSLPNTPTNNVWPLTGRVIEDKTSQNVAEMRSEHINDLPFETCLFRKKAPLLWRAVLTRHAKMMTTAKRKRERKRKKTTKNPGTLKSESGTTSSGSLYGMSSSCASPFLLQGFFH